MRKMFPKACAAALAILSLFVAGCGGGSGSGGGNSPPTPPLPPPPPPFGANFSEIQANVFTPTCAVSGCHSGAGSPQGLRLDEATSYALLVNVASTENGAVLRVNPGNPDDSYLIQKLEGTASAGVQMPFGRAPLTQATIDVIRQWITDGAIDDRVQSSNPVRVTALTPVPGSDGAAPTSIVATFDRELDVSTVNVNTFLLEGSGSDDTFGDGNEVAVTAAAITTPAASPLSATFDLTGVAMLDDTYRVRLLSSGASVILDIDANALDGEFGGTFPSGDGTEGGDFEATFTVTTPPTGATLAAIQASVFTPTCAVAGCHFGATPAGGMNLEDGQTLGNVVNVPSVGMPTMDRVEPGDPDNSFLILRIEGTVAPQMPLIGAPLDQAVINDIRQWISDGANP